MTLIRGNKLVIEARKRNPYRLGKQAFCANPKRHLLKLGQLPDLQSLSMIPANLRLTRLADAASLLLFGGDDDRRSEAAVTSLDQLFRDITGLRENTLEPRDRLASSLPAGCISPLDAGRCLLDVRRTAVYLRGVYDAIQEAQRRFPGEIINILYAGCGPFALLCLPLLPLLAGQAIHFTLLDVHARAIACVREILAAVRLEAANIECLVSDATRYQMPTSPPAHCCE